METLTMKEYEEIPYPFKVTKGEGVKCRLINTPYGVDRTTLYYVYEKCPVNELKLVPRMVNLTKNE